MFCQVLRKPWYRALIKLLDAGRHAEIKKADVSKKGEAESRPYRIRTCDTLIKSQVDIFQDFGLFSKLESAQKLFNF